MKYFAKETVVNSFNLLKGSVDNKLLGLLAILKVIDSDFVIDNKSYCIIDGEVSRVLDDLCYLETNEKNNKYGDTTLYVKFSKQWKDYVLESFFKKQISVYSLIVFIYKFEGFDGTPSHEYLLSKFCKEYHLAQDTVKDWFSLDEISLDFYDEPLTRKELQEALNISSPTISFDSPYSVKARAGEISRAPFIQTLYAGMDSIKCLLILKDDIDLYYENTKALAKNEQTSATTQEAFIRFLSECTNLAEKSPSKYASGLKKLVNERLKVCVTGFNDIYDCTEPAIAEKYRGILQNDEVFVEQNTTGNNMYSTSLDWYIKFLRARKMFSSLRMEQSARVKTSTEPPALPKDLDTKYKPFVAAIKTKPFLLLAGISGTGKSRIVREMARACWPEENPNSKAQEPDNFMMIPVRPNWHDSTELIGYYSGIRERYMPGLFLKAVVKAWEMTTEFSEDGKTMPYFVCLDEMNLAPVEQYFAEYLSVIESRECKEGIYKSDALIRKTDEGFSDLCDELTVCRECQDGAAGGDVMTEEEPQFGKELTHKNKVEKLRSKFSEHGICLPPNLIVCGTVNMDETTFSFSRKVLDRAMTIEMNEVVLKAGLGEAKEQFPPIKSPESLLSLRITPEDYYDAEGKKETIDEVLEWLGKINEKLEGTPFKIAYRTRNEILLYVIHSEELGVGRKRAFDEAVNMKILPRIEGDQKKVGNVLAELTQVLKDEVGIAKEDGSPSMAKLEVMDDRLKKQYYCTYWN